MKFLFTILLAGMFINIYPQTALQSLKGNSSGEYDVIIIRKYIYDHSPEIFKNGRYDKITRYHACRTSYRTAEILNSFDYYRDSEIELYLNNILKEIIPSKFSADTMLHVYLLKDGNFNAFMTPSGKMFINIGVFDNINDEATLAGIMAHELAHFILNHSLKLYIAVLTGQLNRGFSINDEEVLQYTVTQELQADSLSFVLLNNSRYNPNGILNAFEITSMYERNLQAKSAKTLQIEETGHPSSIKRKDAIMNYYRKYCDTTGKSFIIDESLFFKRKESARTEILANLLKSYQFSSCIEKAFKFHLFQPENKLFIWYILEGIRRNCYGNINEWNNLFITDRYYDTLANDNLLKEKLKEPLLKDFDADILTIQKSEIDSIKANFYWDGDIRFRTYEDAFNYFYKVSHSLNDTECIFTNAMSYTRDTLRRNSLLRKYISIPEAVNREFAVALLHDSIESALPTKKLLVLNSISAMIKTGKDEIFLDPESLDSKIVTSNILDSIIKGTQDIVPVYLPSLKSTEYETFCLLEALMTFSEYTTISVGEPILIQILNPQLWYVYKKFGVNEIEFISCSFLKQQGKAKNIDDYWEIADAPIDKILNETKSSRFLNIQISSIKIKKESRPRTFRRYNNIQIKNNKTGYDAIIKTIREYAL